MPINDKVDDIEQESMTQNMKAEEMSVETNSGGSSSSSSSLIPDFLQGKTGSGSLEDYSDNPITITDKRWNKRIARGLKGKFDALDYWFMDVLIGILEMFYDLLTDSKDSENSEKDSMVDSSGKDTENR